ncbi:MAG: hypothetical protein LBM70_03145 [Victivallales bacterium]|jgi:hypothetical protein|nr:hypothetical protein [Victivallales bacterium]
MKTQLQLSLDQAWQQIREQLFRSDTGLCYDYISEFLPFSTEIALGFPNPCGWGTGMEDCALNGGFLLDILRLRGELGTLFAAEIERGLVRLGTVHGVSGFVARGISPRDGKSCYSNSSRDQFTLAVYGLYRVLKHGSLGEDARKLLRDVAEYCERTVTPKNGFAFSRLDGGKAIVSKMWENAPHEALRLPMIYGIAYEATGEERFRELCVRYAIPGLKRTMSLDAEASWWDIPLIQMQLSLCYFAESEIVPDADWRGVMRLVSQIGCRELKKLLGEVECYRGRWNVPCGDWRILPMRIVPETLSEQGAVFDEKVYLNPCFNREFAQPNAFLRGIGNYLGSIALGSEVPLSLVEQVAKILAPLDLCNCTGAGTVSLTHGLSLTLQQDILTKESRKKELQLQGEKV